MDREEIFLKHAKTRAYERLRKRHAASAERIDQLFRRQVTCVGFSAHVLLDGLEIPHRHGGSVHFLPGRVVFVGANTAESELPQLEALHDLLDRGGTVIVEGKALPDLREGERVIRTFSPLFPRSYPETNADDAATAAAYTRVVDRWAKKYLDLVKAIADAL